MCSIFSEVAENIIILFKFNVGIMSQSPVPSTLHLVQVLSINFSTAFLKLT